MYIFLTDMWLCPIIKFQTKQYIKRKEQKAIKDAVSSVGGGSGDIVIPVYLGGTMLVEGFKAKLRKDTSYKGLWIVSFMLKDCIFALVSTF